MIKELLQKSVKPIITELIKETFEDDINEIKRVYKLAFLLITFTFILSIFNLIMWAIMFGLIIK